MSHPSEPGCSADGVAWDLGDLYRDPEDPRLDSDLEGALRRARQFEAAYRGRIDTEEGPSPELLLQAVRELESIYALMDRTGAYASLLHAARTDDPRHGALLSRTRERRTAINKFLLFFELEWMKLADGPARQLTGSPVLAPYRHYLEQKRAWRPHALGEAEERILEEKAVTGRGAFTRLFDETVSALRFAFRLGDRVETLTMQQVNGRLYDPDRGVRKAAAEAWTGGLKENARLLTFVFNNLVLDHRTDTTLRQFGDVMGPRNLANEIRPEVVERLMESVERHHGMVHRYYRLKSRLLGYEPLYDYDRYAPLFADMPGCDWPTARRLVTESYEKFSPRAGAVVREFFDRRWIDAAPRPGKRGGAFSSSTVPSVHPYILMNFTDRPKDAMTLAHELGHGLHQYLARPIGYFQCDTPLTTAEMASVFGEMLTFARLLEVYPDPRIRLGLLCGKIEDGFATVFRQVVLTRFEQALHRERAARGELTTGQINEMWLAANRPMYGDAVRLSEGYAWWWTYIGHFIHSPFYCYAYAFGELLVLALVQKYKQEGEAFVPRYLDLLAAGGSDAPDRLLARMGVDVNDLSFWDLGLRLLNDMVGEAERLADQLTARGEGENG